MRPPLETDIKRAVESVDTGRRGGPGTSEKSSGRPDPAYAQMLAVWSDDSPTSPPDTPVGPVYNDAGLQLLGPDDLTNKRHADALPTGIGYLVAGHGHATVMNAGGREYTPAEVASMIKSDPKWQASPTGPIKLLSCDTGQQFATDLARHFPGVTVIAPLDTVWTDANGNTFVAPKTYVGGQPRPSASPPATDKWIAVQANLAASETETDTETDAETDAETEQHARIDDTVAPETVAARPAAIVRTFTQSHLPGTTPRAGSPSAAVDWAMGLEIEGRKHQLIYAPQGRPWPLDYNTVVLRHSSGNVEVKVDGYYARDGDGKRLKDENGDKLPKVSIGEVVSTPFKVFDRENRPDRATVRDLSAEANRRLDGLAEGDRKTLTELFPESEGWQVTPAGKDVTVLGRDLNPKNSEPYTQYTVGVPLAGATKLLQHVANNSPSVATEGALRSRRGVLEDGIAVADQVRDLYRSWAGDSARDLDAEQVAGAVALMYPHAAAMAYQQVSELADRPGRMMKSYLAVASRAAPAALHAALSTPVRGFLAAHAADIHRMVDQRLGSTLTDPAITTALRDNGLLDDDGNYTVTTAEVDEVGATTREYLDNALLGGDATNKVDQGAFLATHFAALDDNGGRLTDHPLVQVEIRNLAAHESMELLEKNTENLTAVLNDINNNLPATDRARLHEQLTGAADAASAAADQAARLHDGVAALPEQHRDLIETARQTVAVTQDQRDRAEAIRDQSWDAGADITQRVVAAEARGRQLTEMLADARHRAGDQVTPGVRQLADLVAEYHAAVERAQDTGRTAGAALNRASVAANESLELHLRTDQDLKLAAVLQANLEALGTNAREARSRADQFTAALDRAREAVDGFTTNPKRALSGLRQAGMAASQIKGLVDRSRTVIEEAGWDGQGDVGATADNLAAELANVQQLIQDKAAEVSAAQQDFRTAEESLSRQLDEAASIIDRAEQAADAIEQDEQDSDSRSDYGSSDYGDDDRSDDGDQPGGYARPISAGDFGGNPWNSDSSSRWDSPDSFGALNPSAAQHGQGPVPLPAPAATSRSTAETPTCGDPVDITTGRMIYTETDLVLPGLTLERTYRSDYHWGRSFGTSWASTLDQRIHTDDRHTRFFAADGSIRTYVTPAEGAESLALLGSPLPLRRLVGGGWLLTDRDALLVFGPAEAGDDALLCDVVTGDTRWHVFRDSDDTPTHLESSAGDWVDLSTTDRLVTGGWFERGGDQFALPSFGFDNRRQLVEIRNSSGDPVRLRYDDAGRIVRWDDRNGEWYEYTYDEAGRCVRTDGRGGYLRYEFEYGEGVTTAVDSLGGVHRFELNDRLQVIAVTDPLGATTRAEWDAANRPLSRTDPLGRVTRWSYGEPGQPPSITRPDGVPERAIDLSGLDRPRPSRLPDGTATLFGWTAEGDLSWRLGPNGSMQEWHYDGEGNLVEVIDASGRAVNIEYGPFDLPTARIDEAGNRTEFTYDTELRLTAITNPAGAVWRYTYDAAGRLAEQTDFDGRVQRYTHDAAGQLVAHTNAGGETTHYAYDLRGRVIERRIGAAVTRLRYDAEGRVSTVTNPDAEVSFERDGQGRIIAETINGSTVRTSYDGDLVGTRTTPSGRSSRWTFDADGRPASLATGEHVVRFGHDAAGREISRTVDDIVALRQTFDAAGRLAVQRIADTAERDFSYDAADRVTAIADSVAGDRSFESDVQGRIHTVTADGESLERYEYDEAGNLTGAGGGRWVFDGTMLVRSDDATFAYDDRGRLVGRSDAAGTWRFAWDAEDRMVEATTPGGDRWRYRYDGFGRRIAKQRVAADDTVLEQVRFAWSGDLMVEQSGASTISWDFWPDGSAPVTQTDGEALHTIITDLIGTPTHLVGSTGGLRWWSRTDLWGRGQDTAATPLRFPGQYHDAETGLHYNRFRYYDPATARYLSPDPLGLSGGPNPTSYVPDPLTVADPLGLTSCKVASPSLNPLAGTVPSPAVASDGEPSQLPTAATVPSPTALTGAPQVAPTVSQAQQWLADVAAAAPPTLQTSTLQDVQQQLQQFPAQNGSTDGVVLGNDPGRSKRHSTKRDTDRSNGRHHHSHHTRGRRSASPDDGRPRPLTTSVPTRGPDGEALWNGDRRTIPFRPGVRQGLIDDLAQTVYEERVMDRNGHQRRDRNGNRVYRRVTEYTASCGHTVDDSSQIHIDHINGILAHVIANAEPITWFQDLGNGFQRQVLAVPLEAASIAASDVPNLRAICAPCNLKKAKASESKHMDKNGPQFVGPLLAPPDPPPSKFDTPRRRDYDDDQGGGAGFISNPGGFSGGRSSDYYRDRGTTYLNMANGNGTHSATIDGSEIVLPPVSNLSQNADGTWQADGKPLIQHPLTTRPGFALVSDEDWTAMGQGIGIPADTDQDPTPMVVVHGGDSVVAAPVREADGSTSYVALSSSQLDTMSNYPPGSALALASCRIGSPVIGTAGDNFSQDLAVQRNGDVLAPTVDLKLNSRGLWTSDNTPWQMFTAGDLGTDGYDSFNDVKPIAGIAAQQDPTPSTDNNSDTDTTTQVAPGSYTPSAPFTDVAPTAVAKTTAQTPTAGDPIDVTTGRMILTHTDAVLPGLTLERTYRSDYQWGRSFGRSWASTLDQRVIVDGDQVRYLAADGSMLTYPLPAEGDTALPDVGRALPLHRLLGGGWLLTDPTSGRGLVFAPATDTESLLSDVTDGGVRWSIDRDESGAPARLRSSAGSTIGFGSFGDQVTELLLPDPDGALVPAYEFGYNANRELIEVVNSSGAAERFSYLDGRIVQWEDRNGEWYTYDYDEAGRCVGTDGKGGYLRYRFDYQPGLTVVTDSVGAVRRYELNDLLQVVAETDPLGATTHREWDEAYRLRSEVDPLGRTTAYGYDAEGRRTTITRPDGSSSTVAYDERGRAVSWTDFDGSTRNREFDVDGRMLAETDADGMVVGFDLPAANGTETATQAGPTVVVRDAARHVVSMTTGDAETRYEYDSLGRVAGMENEQGVTYFGWTPEGELAWRENPDGSSEEFVYDGEGNLVETLDATGRQTRMEYGAFDMVTAQIDADGNRTEYAYDTELRLTTITNPAGETWRYTYDPNGRMVEETDFGGRTQRYAYDAAGQVVEHTNAAGQVTYYTYDLLGQVIERRTGTAVTRLSYDLAGRILSATDADSTIQLERDALGRVVSETVNGNTVVTSYSERFGAVDARIRPSGAVTRWSYDESGRPSVLAAGDRQVHFGYADGREVSRRSDAGLTLQQSFDDLGRLAAQRIEGVTDRRYTYDQAHRLIAVHDEVQGDRTIDPNGTGQPDAARYTFDALGRPVTRSDAAGEWQFGWDHHDRLITVGTPGGDRWLYRYDALGRRTVKQRVSAKGTMLEEITFTWSGDLLIEQEHKSRGGRASTTSWEYHPALAHPIVQVTDGTVHTVVTDGDGVPMDLVGIDGGPSADLAAIPVRSGGRYLDAETGLRYDGGRYFDPATDRFLVQPREAPAVLR